MTKTMHAPVSIPTREAGPAEANEQPQKTVRVPIVCPPLTAHALVDTPPPSGDRRLTRSKFGGAAEEDCGVGLRVGDTFVGFKLVEELGQGAFARVFLARQESLAGRPVALKVTLRPTREAERLARLQHTNVVPVYSVHNVPPAQVICMPYLGRRTIADVIRAYRNDHPSREQIGRKTSGTRAVRTTDVVDSGSTPKSSPSFAVVRPSTIAPGDSPNLIGDPAAVLRIIAQLAAGLAHAHERGILHLDLKPANVLLPDTGEPMLLDFNLSFDTTTADRELVGGTVPYMAIEQLLDLRTRGGGKIDARTDLYALGVMAFEMLTGIVPFPASSKDLIDMDGLIAVRREPLPSIRELNRAVTPAVESILHKLLAPEPADRYQSAGELKTDLDRHLNDLPLLFARERSPRERFGKWRRRNPGVPGRMFAAALFGLALGLGGVSYQQTEAKAESEAIALVRTTRGALDSVRLDLILPGESKARARGVARADDLLAGYGLPDDANWMHRPEVRRLKEADRAELAAELGELMLLLAQAKWQEAESKTDPAREQGALAALKLNRAAQECFPADRIPPMLARQAAELAFAAGERVEAEVETTRTPTARELFLDAAAGIGAAKYDKALSLLERVVKDQPNHAAGQFCLAYCKEQLGRHDSALERYDVAQSLLTKDARPSFQRGVIFGMRSDHAQAEEEFSRAINLDPDLTNAHRNRGFARFRLEKFKEAEADLTKALALGAPPLQILTYRYQVRDKLGDTTGAAVDRAEAEALTPKHEADYIARGMARLHGNDSKSALADFQAAAEINPRSLVALKNLIHVFADRLGEPEAALDVATRMAKLFPDYATGRITRAVLLARLGRRLDAHVEAELALRLSKDGAITYRAACVFALTSGTHIEDRTQALDYLVRSVKDGFHRVNEIKTDRDLDSLRDTKRFREIEDAITSLYQ